MSMTHTEQPRGVETPGIGSTTTAHLNLTTPLSATWKPSAALATYIRPKGQPYAGKD